MIKEVVIQIASPSRRVAIIGRYKVEDNILTMLDDDDRPLRDRKGIIKRTLEPGEDAATVARKLTRDMHMRRADANEFNRPLHYPDVGWR